MKCFSMQFVQFVCTNSFLKKSFISEFFNLKTWHKWGLKLEHIFHANKMKRNLFVLCKCSLKPLQKNWFFISCLWELLRLFQCCTYLVLTKWPIPPTGCLLDGWFDLIEVGAGTIAPVGTVKEIRFIFLYFLFFYIDLHFYICFSL